MRYSRFFMSIVLSALMLLSSIVITSAHEGRMDGFENDSFIDDVSFGESTFSKYPYIDESESNNDWSTANKLSNSISDFEIHGNLSSASDIDFFMIDLDGGAGPVHQLTLKPDYIETKSDYDYLIIWFFAFTPEVQDEHVVLSLAFYDVTMPTFWKTILVHASYTGSYGFYCQPYNSQGGSVSGAIRYNITASLSYVTPSDSLNDIGSASMVSSGDNSIAGKVDQWLDTYDWYHIPASTSTYPTDLDIKLTIGSVYPDYASNNIAWGVELGLILMYNTRSSPLSFQSSIYRISKTAEFQTAGVKGSPFQWNLQKNCTDIYVGIQIHAYGLSQTSPKLNEKTYTDLYRADAAYTLDLNVMAEIPNNRPVLLDGKVDPMLGNSEELFKFSVIYRDQNNETPKLIQLWLDDEFSRNLAPLPGESFDYRQGVRYGVTMTGASVGSNMIHKFNFTANDGEDVTLLYSSGMGPFSGPRVNDNLPPSSKGTHEENVVEDTDVIYIELDPLFSDPDPGTDFSYRIKDQTGEWSDEYVEDDVITAKLTNGTLMENNNVLTIWPGENIFGDFKFIINASDGGINDLFEEYVELEVIVRIAEINDPPQITRIGSISLEDEPYPTFELDQGEKEEVRVLATDIDGDDITYSWDIEDILASAVLGVDYDWDRDTGELWFITTDGDVPQINPTLTVTDSRGLSSSIEIPFYIYNINDPPFIQVPSFKSTIEGEFLYINPTSGDPDLDDGDIITFSYDMGLLARHTPNKAIDFNPNTGRMQINVISEDMIGEWDIIITVADLYGGFDSGTCHVTIQNVNDRPTCYDISYNSQDQDLSVVFFTSEAEDEDKDSVLIYMWDFGDGSPEVSGADMKTVTHTFPSEGAYSVSMKVFDGEAYSEIKEIVVTLTAPPVDPDMDDDGMLDEWERMAGLDPSDPDDSLLDSDEDGMLNKEEFDYWELYGVFLNPNNPDTDGDGYKDGDEVNNNYDPFSPDSHPSPEYETLETIMWIMGGLFILLAFICLVLFLVLRRRNNPKMIAMPVAAAPVDGYLGEGSMGYQQLPDQGGYKQLPPASTEEKGYQQPQSGYPPVQDQQPFTQELYSGGAVASDEFGSPSTYGDVPSQEYPMQQPPDAAMSNGIDYGDPNSPPDVIQDDGTNQYQVPEVISQPETDSQYPQPPEIPTDFGVSPEIPSLQPPPDHEVTIPPEPVPEVPAEQTDTPTTDVSSGESKVGPVSPLPPPPSLPGSEDP